MRRIDYRIGGLSAAALGLAVVVCAGCNRDAKLADHKIPDEIVVGPVTAYDTALTKTSPPQDVVYVLLKAIVDDYAAGDDVVARDQARSTQLALCAPTEIKRRAAGNRELSPQRQMELLYRAVNHWAPTLGFYRADFDHDYATLTERMHVVERAAPNVGADVYLNLAHPHPDEKEIAAGVVARISLVQEDGFWRIWSVGFERTTRDWTTRPPAGVARVQPADPAKDSGD